LHQWNACKPCAFMFQGGCKNGVECDFCHLCEQGERKRRKKERRKGAARGPDSFAPEPLQPQPVPSYFNCMAAPCPLGSPLAFVAPGAHGLPRAAPR